MSKKKQNTGPLDPIIELYDKCVKNRNKKGYADKFKLATENFFKAIELGFKRETKKKLTIQDVSYGDGYFIFGMGTNSVVHFRIKQIPGWLFAIWWDIPDKDKLKKSKKEDPKDWQLGKDYITGTWFTQYEANIDKFKPSRSEICEEFKIGLNPKDIDELSGDLNIVGNLVFMNKHPELAFCRDWCSWNLNQDYHTDEEAKVEFQKWKKETKLHDNFEKYATKKMIEYYQKEIVSNFKGAYIHDNKDIISPRYEIYVPIEDNMDIFEGIDVKPGVYHFSSFFDEAGMKEIESFKQKLEDEAKKKGTYWFGWDFSDFIYLNTRAKFEEIETSCEEE